MLSPEHEQLARQQLALRDLLRGRPVDVTSDAWLAAVAQSRGLRAVRETLLSRQRLHLESTCRCTSRLMKRLGCFDSHLQSEFPGHSAPPAPAELAPRFLSSLRAHEDPLLRAIAAFELATLAPPEARAATAVTFWDRNPDAVMHALDRGAALPPPEPDTLYVLRVGPGGVTCTRRQIAARYPASELFTLPSRSTRQSYAAMWQRPSASASLAVPSASAHIRARPSRRHAVPQEHRPSSMP